MLGFFALIVLFLFTWAFVNVSAWIYARIFPNVQTDPFVLIWRSIAAFYRWGRGR